MDIRINDNVKYSNVCANQRCCVSSSSVEDCDSMNSSNHLLDNNDHATLISDSIIQKYKKFYCLCSLADTSAKSSKPWITFIHVLCTVRAHFGC